LSIVTNREYFTAATAPGKYGPSFSDIECAGLRVDLATIEVGYLGHLLPSTISNLYMEIVIVEKCL